MYMNKHVFAKIQRYRRGTRINMSLHKFKNANSTRINLTLQEFKDVRNTWIELTA